MLIIHEVMGRNCGWLTAYTAKVYHDQLNNKNFVPKIGLSKKFDKMFTQFLFQKWKLIWEKKLID